MKTAAQTTLEATAHLKHPKFVRFWGWFLSKLF